MEKLTNKIPPETERYLNNFYQPYITAYKFLELFFAVLYKQGTTRYQREFSEIIRTAKEQEKFKNLLQDIHFKSNGIYYYSDQIDEGISSLKVCELIETVSPQEKIIVINYTENIVNMILSQYSADDIEKVTEIIMINNHK